MAGLKEGGIKNALGILLKWLPEKGFPWATNLEIDFMEVIFWTMGRKRSVNDVVWRVMGIGAWQKPGTVRNAYTLDKVKNKKL